MLGATGPIVLTTRPHHQAGSLAGPIASLGLTAVNEPLLDIVGCSPAPDWWLGTQALAVTSPNGAWQLRNSPAALKRNRVFAVGPATARLLEKFGFARVEAANGTGRGLVDLIIARAEKTTGIAHVSGQHIACDIAAELARNGYRSKRVILYRADLRACLTQTTRELCHSGRIGLVTVMSKRVAERLSLLMKRAGLTQTVRSARAIAMSPSIADRLDSQGWAHIEIASEPSVSAIVEVIARHARGEHHSRYGLGESKRG